MSCFPLEELGQVNTLMKSTSHQEKGHFQCSEASFSAFPVSPSHPACRSLSPRKCVSVLQLDVAGPTRWGLWRVLLTQARLPVPGGVRATLLSGEKVAITPSGARGGSLQHAECPLAQGWPPAPGLSRSKAVFAFGGLSTGCTVLYWMTGE